MKESIKTIRTKKMRRARRVRAVLVGSAERPRMSVHISNRYLYVQLIDDATKKTLCTVKTPAGKSHVTVADAQALGKQVATVAAAKGISAVIFDRGARKYHGRIKAVADAAREGGLSF